MSSVSFSVLSTGSQTPQIVAGFDDTSVDEKPLKRRSYYREESERVLKRGKVESKISLANEIKIITNLWLAKQFKRGDILGRSMSDAFSMVFAVENLETKESMVLKITDALPPLEVLSKIKSLWEQQKTIHLTETVLLGKIQVCSGGYLQSDHKPGEFVILPRINQKNERWAYVYLMPRMEGDLKALKAAGLSVVEEAAIEVVRLATEAFLNKQGIEPFDMKDINILTRPLTSEDGFQGKHILRYDYLKYTIGSETYYLPVSRHLITLCDYDKWKPTQVEQNFTGSLGERLKRAPKLLAEIEKFKIPPAEQSRILPMN